VAGVPKELLGPDIQAAVLKEARALLELSQATCQQLLQARRGELDAFARRLLERELLSGDELRGLLGAAEMAPAL
jgi:cell division protease FtsH